MAKRPAPSSPERTATDVVHRVQRTGSSSLTVTLPKSWVESIGLSNGDLVRLRNLGAGRLELTQVANDELRREEKVLSIEVRHDSPNLISRLIVGGYVTGQDLIRLHARDDFLELQLDEVRQTVSRVLGMSVVEERQNRVEIQVFVDPTRHKLSHLRGRAVRLLRTEIELCRRLLTGQATPGLKELSRLEEETDRVYLLMVRQLLLASDDFRVAREIGVPSHHHQVGERLVAKLLEMTGDLLYDAGHELLGVPQRARKLSPGTLGELDRLFERFDGLLVQTMDAFSQLSEEASNSTLNGLRDDLDRQSAFNQLLARRYPDVRTGMLVQRIVSNLHMAWEMLVAINEVALNRSTEPERFHPPGPDRGGGPDRSPPDLAPMGVGRGR